MPYGCSNAATATAPAPPCTPCALAPPSAPYAYRVTIGTCHGTHWVWPHETVVIAYGEFVVANALMPRAGAARCPDGSARPPSSSAPPIPGASRTTEATIAVVTC